jgi:type II secretory pathway pseudopilin PulG
MKHTRKSILGVTLLEIMLVLAIAAMVIVMSVRYYQTATTAQQANAIIEQLQAITVAADSLAQATGSYSSAFTNSNYTSQLGNLLPKNSFSTPWGTSIALSGIVGNQYVMTIGTVPAAACTLMRARISANNHYSGITSCAATATSMTITYLANP